MDVRRRGLRTDLLVDDENASLAGGLGDARLPLAIPSIEEEQLIAGRHPEHVEQVIGLGALSRDLGASVQGRPDEEALSVEVVGHG
jgi:hypothetical protein